MAQAVEALGINQWKAIAALLSQQQLSTRSAKQCRERWRNHLDPAINKTTWSEEEHRTLFTSQRQLGNQWKAIAALLPGRTDNAVKNYFYSTLRRNLRLYNQARPHTQRLHGCVRTLLRRPAVVDLLVDVDPSLTNIEEDSEESADEALLLLKLRKNWSSAAKYFAKPAVTGQFIVEEETTLF